MINRGHLVGALIAVAVLLAALSGSLNSSSSRASDTPYAWWSNQDDVPDGHVVLWVDPLDRNDWTDYMAANQARIADWVSDPPAETFEDKVVSVTFNRPVSLPLFKDVVAPLKGTVERTVVTGKERNGRRFSDTYFDAPQERWFEPGFTAMASQERAYEYTVSGIIVADLSLGDLKPDDLAAVDSHPVVHLLDTTAVQVMMDHSPDELGGEVAVVELDSPWHLLPWSRKVATEAVATQAAITPEPRATVRAYP